MNSILQLKGRFDSKKNSSKPGAPQLPKGAKVSSKHLYALRDQLKEICSYWNKDTRIGGALVSVHYTRIVAKSNRLSRLLTDGARKPADSVCGAKFEWNKERSHQWHVFTHFVSLNAIDDAVKHLNKAADWIEKKRGGCITSEDVSRFATDGIAGIGMAKTTFLEVVRDSFHVSRFDIDRMTDTIRSESIITIYQTAVETKSLLAKFGIRIVDDRIIDRTTLRLRPDEVQKLQTEAPYLIAMNVTDFTKLMPEDEQRCNIEQTMIPQPKSEPVIGVIDTLFDRRVYFHDWVEDYRMIDDAIPISSEDYQHGTAVSSILVDGPRGNPRLDDGCGRFRVRHFGVATASGFSSFAVLRMIRSIVASHPDIKVWNLSLGSPREIPDNFISPEASEIDRIQNEYDVIFVVAGTNKSIHEKNTIKKIGAPADSLNAIVVNATDFKGKPASYTRVGPVLSFFKKPDVSYYGGDGTTAQEKIVVCTGALGASYVSGTSFAAPWIARKLAYLIYVMGLSREVAKALLIDAAAGWNRQDYISAELGYGVVPTHIRDIVQTREDEIRFIITGQAEEYETFTYNLPVPAEKETHPFYARATLAYFPACDRNQGVDYTRTELDLHFGRIHKKNGKATIKDVQGNEQADAGLHVIYEEEARRVYRKWDNVKHISDVIAKKVIPRKMYESGLWGISIKAKERIARKRGEPLPFGIVVTLKEMYGHNRYADFIKECTMRGWLVNQLNVENQLEIYTKAEEELQLE